MSQQIVAANKPQVSVGIKINLEVNMSVQDRSSMVYKTVAKMKAIIAAVACVSCLSSAPLTRICIYFMEIIAYAKTAPSLKVQC